MTTPVVSVLMITRNHGAFLAQAIDSVLDQDMAEALELLIGEDGSDDESATICADYARRYPKRVRLMSSPHGAVGMHANFRRLFDAARGRFLAFLEGDDFWLDRDKLSRQVALLEGTPALSMCGTRTAIIERDASGLWRPTGVMGPAHPQTSYTFAEMIPHYNFHFSSVMVRRQALALPAWVAAQYCIDRPLYLLATQWGQAGFIDAVTSGYRQHTGGVWSSRGLLDKAEASRALFQAFMTHFPAEYRRAFRRTLVGILWYYLSLARAADDRSTTARLLMAVLRATPLQMMPAAWRKMIATMIWLSLPRLHGLIRSTGLRA